MNTDHLMVVRATTRSREFAIRLAIGGTRTDVIRQMTVEAGVLALLAAVAASLLAQGTLSFIQPRLPRAITFAVPEILEIDLRIGFYVFRSPPSLQ